jgi:hypothetical protein
MDVSGAAAASSSTLISGDEANAAAMRRSYVPLAGRGR